MTLVDRSLGVALGAAVMAGIVWGSNAPLTVHGSENAVLRLAWSARPERVEQCRRQSEEELAKLPPHMRLPVVCDGVSAQYRLTVRSGDAFVAEQIVRGGGLRQDRRLYVFHEVPLEPGKASIEVRFDRIDAEASTAPSEERGQPPPGEPPDVRRPIAVEVVPAHLLWQERLQVGPREVILVTYSPERRALVAVRHEGR